MTTPLPSPVVRASRAAFTLVELLTVVAIVGVLAAILIPVVGRARDSARNAECVSRLHDWASVIFLCAGDNRGAYQISNWASAASNPYMPYFQSNGTTLVRHFGGCPLVNQSISDGSMCYSFIWPSVEGDIDTELPQPSGQNQFVRLSQMAHPSQFLMMCDTMKGASPRIRGAGADYPGDFAQMVDPLFGAPPQNASSRGDETVALRHGGDHLNGVFGDGSVRRITGTPAGQGDRNSIYEMRTTWFQLY